MSVDLVMTDIMLNTIRSTPIRYWPVSRLHNQSSQNDAEIPQTTASTTDTNSIKHCIVYSKCQYYYSTTPSLKYTDVQVGL